MIVVDQKQTKLGQVVFEDPVITELLTQFSEKVKEVRELNPDEIAAHRERAKELAICLCDGSRDIIYRMHRVTRKQVARAAQLFSDASDIIGKWGLDDLVSSYGIHIAKRASLMKANVD